MRIGWLGDWLLHAATILVKWHRQGDEWCVHVPAETVGDTPKLLLSSELAAKELRRWEKCLMPEQTRLYNSAPLKRSLTSLCTGAPNLIQSQAAFAVYNVCFKDSHGCAHFRGTLKGLTHAKLQRDARMPRDHMHTLATHDGRHDLRRSPHSQGPRAGQRALLPKLIRRRQKKPPIWMTPRRRTRSYHMHRTPF